MSSVASPPVSIAQTNLQLYQQLMQDGRDESEIELVGAAYTLASRIFSGQLRGSDKPLLAHLVGTAGIVARLGRPAPVVAAALLHAAYADGDVGRRRMDEVLRSEVGPEVERLVRAYDSLVWSYETEATEEVVASLPRLSAEERDVLLVRVANELEDHLDLAPHYHGAPEDHPERYKGGAWRLDYMDRIEPSLVAIARGLDQPELAGWIEAEFARCRDTEVPVGLRTGHTTIWTAAPESYRRRVDAVVRHGLRRQRRRVARARQLGVRATAAKVLARLRRLRTGRFATPSPCSKGTDCPMGLGDRATSAPSTHSE
ncbi:MAG: HD domain-containing protein [Acidimicrobiales bacterium]